MKGHFVFWLLSRDACAPNTFVQILRRSMAGMPILLSVGLWWKMCFHHGLLLVYSLTLPCLALLKISLLGYLHT